jgi:mannose-6-phosphate isomerase-like protein (cupin superfamily)
MQKIKYNNKLLAIKSNITKLKDVITFITPSDFGLQVGYHKRKINEHIKPHEHLPFENIEKLNVQEMFYITKGKVTLKLYHENVMFKELLLEENDIIVLNCGHELKFNTDSEMIEVKQGPYRGNEFEKRYI